MTLEELKDRHEALTQSVELLRDRTQEIYGAIDKVIEASNQDGEHIRALVRIAEIHERRLTDLEGGEA